MLVVRVKRRRDERPVDSICVVEDGDGVAKRPRGGLAEQMQSQLQMDDLSPPDAPTAMTANAKQIVLKRMTTLASTTRTHLDQETKHFLGEKATRTRSDSTPDEAEGQQQRKRGRLVVTQHRSRFQVNDQACVVVDMMQMPAAVEATVPTAAKGSATPVKVLDPATRALERGIQEAIKRGDFGEISHALIVGANPNHQMPLDKGGYTALMAAALKTNVRVVKRLLLAGVDPTIRNQSGQTAMDLVVDRPGPNQSDAQETRQLLQSALIQYYQLRADEAKKQLTRPAYESTVNNEDYVVDVYCLASDGQTVTTTDAASTGAIGAGDWDPSTTVKVDGLRILDDGQVDLLLYDSDWSDLADDEDPDSNDERFEGNDYPDEEDSDPEAMFRDDADEEDDDGEGENGAGTGKASGGNGGRRAHDEDEDDDSDEDELDEERARFRSHQRSVRNTVRSIHNHRRTGAGDGGGASMYDDLQFADGDGYDDVPLFEQLRRVGKVLPEQFLGPDGEVVRPHDTESLQALWGQAPDASRTRHEDRVEQMRQRTGMVFAANPHEFADSGLAKYGAELSDDEADERLLLASAYSRDARLPSTMVAYDSELDGEEDD